MLARVPRASHGRVRVASRGLRDVIDCASFAAERRVSGWSESALLVVGGADVVDESWRDDVYALYRTNGAPVYTRTHEESRGGRDRFAREKPLTFSSKKTVLSLSLSLALTLSLTLSLSLVPGGAGAGGGGGGARWQTRWPLGDRTRR